MDASATNTALYKTAVAIDATAVKAGDIELSREMLGRHTVNHREQRDGMILRFVLGVRAELTTAIAEWKKAAVHLTSVAKSLERTQHTAEDLVIAKGLQDAAEKAANSATKASEMAAQNLAISHAELTARIDLIEGKLDRLLTAIRGLDATEAKQDADASERATT